LTFEISSSVRVTWLAGTPVSPFGPLVAPWAQPVMSEPPGGGSGVSAAPADADAPVDPDAVALPDAEAAAEPELDGDAATLDAAAADTDADAAAGDAPDADAAPPLGAPLLEQAASVTATSAPEMARSRLCMCLSSIGSPRERLPWSGCGIDRRRW